MYLFIAFIFLNLFCSDELVVDVDAMHSLWSGSITLEFYLNNKMPNSIYASFPLFKQNSNLRPFHKLIENKERRAYCSIKFFPGNYGKELENIFRKRYGLK